MAGCERLSLDSASPRTFRLPDRLRRSGFRLDDRALPGYCGGMKIATSRITAQGQISVPLEVRKRLGLVPGATIEWDVEDEKVVVKRAGKYTLDDAHKVPFPNGPPATRTLEELKEGLAGYIRAKHARG